MPSGGPTGTAAGMQPLEMQGAGGSFTGSSTVDGRTTYDKFHQGMKKTAGYAGTAAGIASTAAMVAPATAPVAGPIAGAAYGV